jgi:hypothetical protein
MFANAYKLARHFTKPVIVSTRFFDTTVECECGAFIVLNDEGWIITVAHLWRTFFAFQQHSKERNEYTDELQTLQKDQKLDAKQKRKKIGHLRTNNKWITNHSFWWGYDGIQLKDIKTFPDGDLAIGRLEPFDPKAISVYPVLKDPGSNLDIGTSLCKLGFPFHEMKATFDDAKNAFELAPGAVPLPLFPIEGIFTRNVIAGRSKDGKYEIKYLETSTPGLRGQSGGPIFDSKGTIWALQSRTSHFPLGFSPKLKIGGKEIEENQFLNVGWGVHTELIVEFLKDHGVRFRQSDY